ncbi:Inner membrane ABC transporter ATP-binding protein YddA [Burkholderia multivorans]|uniref:ABC transporter ATP-binding protein/permease n=1 Tax=Burkholderia multivorans TaxID=87883 RepID=UPI002861EB63|nr:ABC transporter ATP-binding protein/permease [Burkholderia multivorans]MDR9057895.1 Inner membrane ABC transporter ATP-binding protein YddA [Burkholderia multivorans]MDR9069806.1 Inner membrane ABC transporter ATP-binding protein YddA [Burkholderia multivorans]MDR9081432.1 Inner membrane ABC transporter ATP-binding protein YddA [Burkholderia multivorans]MDR9104390.1 Inner membrane ABC transporter ATP-binding protein YddA [Burkholderia multivorans]MDR9123113.1 Inner membrane ABC transporter 
MTQSIDPVRSASDAPQDERPVSAWSLIKPYWVSSEWKVAWALLVTIIAINLCVVWINVQLNKWNAQFYNALQTKNVHDFPHLMMQFSMLAFGFIVLAVYGLYLRQMLGFRWRQWLTDRFLGEWLGDRAFYRIERDRLADNPDQRVADDLQAFATTTLSLSLDLLSTVVTLASFITILWTLGGALTLSLGATPVSIPGYMVWAAALYAVVGSLVIQKVGRPLVSINYQQQRVEADFRFGLIRVRENAEQIAFYDGEDTENRNAQGLFLRIRDNWWRVMKYTKRLTFVNAFYGQIAIIFPFVVAAPRYFAGAFTLGVLMQISSAFGTVSNSFSWFLNSYRTLVEWRATVNRLREFKRVMRTSHLKESLSPATEHGGINLHYVNAAKLSTSSLKLALPNGNALANIGSVTIEPGSRWLVVGKSGSGKSTFMRALAGLWPFGDGAIDAPVGARMMFVPQSSYLPIGTLKAALAYPSAPDAFGDDACRDALRACHLEDYVDRLDETAHWTRVLSPGEQQRLAGARVLLHKPDFLFLDEATSALDGDNEARLYRLFAERLPKAAIVSIAHRESLAAFHGGTINVERVNDSDKVAA